eukprot:8514226-Heterocapsa_arctica.AAC.1
MNAGALHTIITDGVWYPERAAKRGKNCDGLCLLCKCGKKADSNTYGGNVKPATRTQLITGYSYMSLDNWGYYKRLHSTASN